MTGNTFDMMIDFFKALLSVGRSLKSFLFASLDLGFIEISVWGLITGGALVTVLVMVFIKAVL